MPTELYALHEKLNGVQYLQRSEAGMHGLHSLLSSVLSYSLPSAKRPWFAFVTAARAVIQMRRPSIQLPSSEAYQARTCSCTGTVTLDPRAAL